MQNYFFKVTISIKMNKVIAFIQKYRYCILIFLLLSFQLYTIMPNHNNIDPWCIPPYVFSYTNGFASRFLIGSLLNLFTPFISIEFIHRFIVVSTLFLCLLLALFIDSSVQSNLKTINAGRKIFKKTKLKHISVAFIAIVSLYLASPASPAYLFSRANFGRLDVYLLIFTLISLFCARRGKLILLIPLIAIAALATHQVFLFTYFPVFLVILLYHTYEQKFSKKSLLFCASSLVIVCAVFIYFQFFSSLNVSSSDEFIKLLQLRTDALIEKPMIEFEYFLSIGEHSSFFITPEKFILGLVTLGFMLPLHLILIGIYLQAKKYSRDKSLRLLFALIMGLPVFLLPALVLTFDWGRWFAALYTVQVLVMLYLAKANCLPLIKAMEKFGQWVINNLFIIILLILFLSSLGKFSSGNILDLVAETTQKIFDSLHLFTTETI